MEISNRDILLNGIIKNNPVFVMMLGLCPTLGVTVTSFYGFAMGIATMLVIVTSNLLISLLKYFIPHKIRIPVFVMVIASLGSIVELLMKAYTPELFNVFGIFIPLISVNCVVLARVEAFAFKNSVLKSILDGIGCGLGFTLALVFLGTVREVIGNGTAFGINILPPSYTPALLFSLAPGAFLTIGLIIAVMNYCKSKKIS